MKEIKTRKTYEKPTTTVVVMQHRTQLLKAAYKPSAIAMVKPTMMLVQMS